MGHNFVFIKRMETVITLEKGENIATDGERQKAIEELKSVKWENCICIFSCKCRIIFLTMIIYCYTVIVAYVK